MFVLFSSLRIPGPYLLLKNPRALLLRDLDFLSTCLGTDSLTRCGVAEPMVISCLTSLLIFINLFIGLPQVLVATREILTVDSLVVVPGLGYCGTQA